MSTGRRMKLQKLRKMCQVDFCKVCGGMKQYNFDQQYVKMGKGERFKKCVCLKAQPNELDALAYQGI